MPVVWQLIYICTQPDLSKLFCWSLGLCWFSKKHEYNYHNWGNHAAFCIFLLVICFVRSLFKIWKFNSNWILRKWYNGSEGLHIAMLQGWKSKIKRNNLKYTCLEIWQKRIPTSNKILKITFELSGRICILMKWWLGAKLIISFFSVWVKAVRKVRKGNSSPSFLPAKQWRTRIEALSQCSPTFLFAPRAQAIGIIMK